MRPNQDLGVVDMGRAISTYRGYIPHPWREARGYAHPGGVMMGLMFGVKVCLAPTSPMVMNVVFPVCAAAATWVMVYVITGIIRPFERWRRKAVLHERGMVGQSEFGFRRTFLWEEIRSVKLVYSHYFFLVASREARPRTLWIPWEVREPRRFAEEVAMLAGASNPLAEDLRRRSSQIS